MNECVPDERMVMESLQVSSPSRHEGKGGVYKKEPQVWRKAPPPQRRGEKER